MNLDLDNLGDNDLDVNLDVNLDLDLEGHPFRDSKKLRYTKTTYYYTSNTKYTFTSSPIRTLLQSESIILQNKENIVSTCKHNYIYEVVTNSPVSIHKFKDDIIISSNNFTINKLYYIYSTEAQQEFSLDITPKYLEKYITLAVENQEETYVNFIKKYLILLTDTNLKNIASMNQNLLNKILDQFLVDNSYDVYTIFKANHYILERLIQEEKFSIYDLSRCKTTDNENFNTYISKEYLKLNKKETKKLLKETFYMTLNSNISIKLGPISFSEKYNKHYNKFSFKKLQDAIATYMGTTWFLVKLTVPEDADDFISQIHYGKITGYESSKINIVDIYTFVNHRVLDWTNLFKYKSVIDNNILDVVTNMSC